MEMVPIPIFSHNQLRRALFNRNWAIYVENNPVSKKWRKLRLLYKKSTRYCKISVKYTGTRYKILISDKILDEPSVVNDILFKIEQ